MALISVKNLTFCHEGSYDNVFENVSFNIDTNWKLGFTGRNGRGKTTFLKLLLGKFTYSGSIHTDVHFDYFPFDVDDKGRNTIDIVDEILYDYELWQLVKELSQLEVSDEVLYRPFNSLSNGEQTKVLLALLFLKRDRFLLIDEPTNHLDNEARKVVSQYLNKKKSFILVSHDRALLDECIDHILSINRTKIEIQAGNFSSWYHNKQLQDAFELKQNDELKREIKRLERSANEKAGWSDIAEGRKIGFDPAKVEKNIGRRPSQAAKAKKMMSRAKAIESRNVAKIEKKSSLLKNVEESEVLKLSEERHHAKKMFELKNISIFYEDKKVCNEVSFCVEQGDRISIHGKNGSGKSSILKLICGEEIGYHGEFYKANGLKISYVSQNTDYLSGSLVDFEKNNQLDTVLFRAILVKLGFSKVQFDKNIENFSDGQKKKILIVKSLCERAHLYIWDEPLNYIDVISRIQIENLLRAYQPTIIFVEHDSVFSNNISNKVVEL